ncbi:MULTISPECIES: hypothetical protein [unclassified Salinibacterium]|uniref:hypothetical protein n=1 Tax=unclassified Salinibacterium TaxID=2632331 RepID=UPI00142266B1|nr:MULTISPECIES: hypothetical protein [unclassified Salinibacterium]
MKLLPSERQAGTIPDITVIDDETWAVLSDRDTLGYVVKAGSVYVALKGPDRNHAVEVGQSLIFTDAVLLAARR